MATSFKNVPGMSIEPRAARFAYIVYVESNRKHPPATISRAIAAFGYIKREYPHLKKEIEAKCRHFDRVFPGDHPGGRSAAALETIEAEIRRLTRKAIDLDGVNFDDPAAPDRGSKASTWHSWHKKYDWPRRVRDEVLSDGVEIYDRKEIAAIDRELRSHAERYERVSREKSIRLAIATECLESLRNERMGRIEGYRQRCFELGAIAHDNAAKAMLLVNRRLAEMTDDGTPIETPVLISLMRESNGMARTATELMREANATDILTEKLIVLEKTLKEMEKNPTAAANDDEMEAGVIEI